MYDMDMAREHLDALAMAEELGLEVIRKGRNHYIRCPEHEKRLGKPDRNINNCIIDHDGYHCFACGAHGNAIRLGQAVGLSFVGSLEMALTAAGCDPADFQTDGYMPKEADTFPLTQEELDMIGLKSTVYGLAVLNCVYGKKDCPQNWSVAERMEFLPLEGYKEFVPGYDVGKSISASLRTLWKEDRDTCILIIQGKIWEAIQDVNAVLESDIIHKVCKNKNVAQKMENDMIQYSKKLNELSEKFNVQIKCTEKKMNSRFIKLRAAL